MTGSHQISSLREHRAFVDAFTRKGGAFGNPEGTGTDFSEIVAIDERFGVGIPDPSDGRVRVLVGRKGAGKTLYKRVLKDHAQRNDSVGVEPGAKTADAPQTHLIETRHVIQVGHWFTASELTEIWTQLWNRAILFSLASYVIRSDIFASHVSLERREELLRSYSKLLRNLGTRPRSPFTVARDFIVSHRNGRELAATLDNALWDDLEQELGELLADAPPFYIYMDAIDENFAHAPMYWMRCQKGLFYYVMRVLRHSDLSGRLHIVICVRDLVMSSVYQSEHAPRYRSDPHIRVLNWGAQSIRYLLDQKAQTVDSRYFSKERGKPDSFGDWIGLSQITNRRGIREDVASYVLRHTQLVPRDVILLGNSVGEILERKVRGGEVSQLTEGELLDVVSEYALASCLVQIQLCANQLSSEFIPPEATRYGFLDFYTASEEFQLGHADALLALLRGLETQRVSPARIAELVERGRGVFDPRADVASVLWQNGLLGYQKDGRDFFYSLDLLSRFKLPTGVDEYVLHPALFEAAGLTSTDRPVSPFPEGTARYAEQ